MLNQTLQTNFGLAKVRRFRRILQERFRNHERQQRGCQLFRCARVPATNSHGATRHHGRGDWLELDGLGTNEAMVNGCSIDWQTLNQLPGRSSIFKHEDSAVPIFAGNVVYETTLEFAKGVRPQDPR